ncbi:MAG TPA: vWA domain-containing protein [Pyrinomonadaceae bacterium]|nr:vWA domain-containing protein [Pyrinomonadaceae bacterium]
MLDDTGSMRSQFETVFEIGKGVVHQVHDHGPVSLFDFASEGIGPASKAIPTPRIMATQDERVLNRTIENLYIQGGQTMLLDAIEFIGDSLDQQSPDTNKVIILITDGEERTSKINQKQLIRKLKEHKTSVFAIGLVQQLDKSRSKAVNLLKDITKETGGRVVFPKSDRPDLQSLLAELAIPIQ